MVHLRFLIVTSLNKIFPSYSDPNAVASAAPFMNGTRVKRNLKYQLIVVWADYSLCRQNGYAVKTTCCLLLWQQFAIFSENLHPPASGSKIKQTNKSTFLPNVGKLLHIIRHNIAGGIKLCSISEAGRSR